MKIRFDEYSNSEYVTSWDTGKIDSLNDVAEIENAAEVEEIDVADYAVSVEAQEVAVNAEIENAKNAKAKVKEKTSLGVREIFAMQKELKKFLWLGEIERAENIFSNIKVMLAA